MSDNNKSLHPITVIVIIHTGDDGIVATFIKFYHASSKNLKSIKINQMYKVEVFVCLRTQVAEVSYCMPKGLTHFSQANIVVPAKFQNNWVSCFAKSEGKMVCINKNILWFAEIYPLHFKGGQNFNILPITILIYDGKIGQVNR